MFDSASLLPLDEVARWVAHAQQMPPEVVQSFVDNGITGYDFPELLQRDGLLLEQELGIRRQTLKRRLRRGMRMKLLGMGNHPPAPELLALATLPATTARATTAGGVPVHSLLSQQQQRQASQSPQKSPSEGGGGGDDEQSCEVPTVLIQWGSGGEHSSSQQQLLPEFLDPLRSKSSSSSSNDMDFPVHKYQLYRERGLGDTPLFGQSRPEAVTLAGKDMLIYEVRRGAW